ncbi:hypothetical protein HRI_000551200 [Hibiscus trionum]|uniref:RING-type E3 ubiquitin transferase n=1 Tax=Hibiscus trionum TaxID=183268 RepID=A0A9W7H0C4_HIBTR|nr:hypothetical protein HRI_000551200 [Hibiscus trionum]
MQSQGEGQGSNSRENPNFRPILVNSGSNPNNVQMSSNQGAIVPTNLPGQGNGTGSGPSDPVQLNLNEPRLTLDLFRSGRSSGNQQISASGGSSSPITIHSGSTGYVLEENISRPTHSHGQSRLLCKRRASEVAQPQNSIVINITHGASSSNNGTHLATQLARALAARSIQVGQTDNFQRNTRLRTIVSQQNPGPVNVSAWNTNNFSVQQATGHHHPRSVFSPLGSFPTQNSPQMPVMGNPTMLPQHQHQQPIVGVPNHLQQVHNPLHAPLSSQYWNNGTTMPAHGHSSIVSTPFMTPLPSANMSLVNGSPSLFGSVTGSSGTISSPGRYNSPFSSVGYGYHHRSMAEQNAQRLHHVLDRRTAPAHNPNESATTIGDVEVALRNDSFWSTQVPPRPGAIAERQAGNNSLLSRPMTPQMAAERRSRLIYQIRNYLRIVRRTGGLRIEDATEMGRSFLQSMYALENVNDDMRLDVDNMSHEELLELEEQMGNVSTGLSEETILANLRRRRFLPITAAPPTAEAEQCCICQENYADEDELGKLDCGHDFHFNCIKPWLVQKNLCPVCKKTALAI